ncbi:outer membrane protein assembly factor BamE domain-containing protein [Neptunicella marina]|uniref:Outer membrane protein assembly factor BamE n=1 Tax=Neptunicella marina TaxID=2125989 RepID=A0A8J6IY18_9ALTE|nr:outer membrane protein assembly factor BamE [Neptunicella marina]MBC3767490.1 outer membrane protein assembly factor BamE [Neptunicella marina]
MKKQLIVLACLCLSACSKVTMENYDKLEVGMSQQDVKSLLGAPDACEEKFGTNSCIWGDKSSRFIKVSFIADKAVFFEKNALEN